MAAPSSIASRISGGTGLEREGRRLVWDSDRHRFQDLALLGYMTLGQSVNLKEQFFPHPHYGGILPLVCLLLTGLPQYGHKHNLRLCLLFLGSSPSPFC